MAKVLDPRNRNRISALHIMLWACSAQAAERLQAQEVEQCSSCDVEVLITTPPAGGAEPRPGSLSQVPLHTGYCPQSVTLLWDRPALQPTTSVTN